MRYLQKTGSKRRRKQSDNMKMQQNSRENTLIKAVLCIITLLGRKELMDELKISLNVCLLLSCQMWHRRCSLIFQVDYFARFFSKKTC